MNNKRIAITAVLVAVSMLAGIVATTPITTVCSKAKQKRKLIVVTMTLQVANQIL